MFEREDGILIRISDVLPERKYVIEVLLVSCAEVVSLDLSFVEFEDLFRYNSVLMNPNKMHERYEWIAERINVVPSETGNRVSLSETSVSVLLTPTLDSESKLAVGRLGYAERRRLREEVITKELKRTEAIQAKVSIRRENFMRALLHFRKEKEKRAAERIERISAEEAERMRLKKVAQERNLYVQSKRAELDKLRSDKINDRETARLIRMRKRIFNILEEAGRKREESIARLSGFRAKRSETESKRQFEQKRCIEFARSIERKREEAFLEREMRWRVKADKMLMVRDESVKKLARAAILLNEKKKAQLYSLFGHFH